MSVQSSPRPTAVERPLAAAGVRLGPRGVALQDGPEYERLRRVWNASVQRRPALLVRCSGAADVVQAVRHATSRGLPLSVRGGGYGLAGHAVCDGVVLDLSPMKGVRVDTGSRTAQAQAGLTWAELDHETQAFGLATPGAKLSSIGIAGSTLGGGYGWLMRRHGLTIDNLLSVDVVTADGAVLTAAPDEHADLFWALRGGGGNFGVVTSLSYRLHRVGPVVLGGVLLHDAARAGDLLRFVRGWLRDAPDEVTVLVALRIAPPAPFVPPRLRMKPVAIAMLCYAGPPEEGAEVVAPLRAFGPPAVDRVGPMPYVAVQRMLDASGAYGYRGAARSDHLAELDDDAIGILTAHAVSLPSPWSVLLVVALGGAIRRVGDDATAFSPRAAGFDYAAYALWKDEADSARNVAWAVDLGDAMRPLSIGVYVNQLGESGQEHVRRAYSEAAYRRLVAVKHRYDAGNVFRSTHNIPPTLEEPQ